MLVFQTHLHTSLSPSTPNRESSSEEKSTDKGFANSPDIINVRFWLGTAIADARQVSVSSIMRFESHLS